MAGSDAAGRLLAGGLSDLGAGLGQGLIGRRARRDERDEYTTQIKALRQYMPELTPEERAVEESKKSQALRDMLPQQQGPSIDDFLESPAKQRKKLTDTLKGALPDDDLASMSLGELKGTVQSLKAQLDFGGEMMRQQQEQERQNAQLALLSEVLPDGQYKSLAQGMASVGLGADAFGDLVGTVLDPMQDNRLAEMDFGFRREDADRKYALDFLGSMRADERQLDAADFEREKFNAAEEQRQFENVLAQDEMEMKRRAAEGAGKDLTESQAKSVATIGQAINAFNQLGQLEEDGIDRLGAGRLIGLGNSRFNQASRQMAMGLLRDESGAVISDKEIKNKIRNLFPTPRDGEAVREQKRLARIGEIGTRQLKIPERMRADQPIQLRQDDSTGWDRLPNGVVVVTTAESGRMVKVRKTSRGPEFIEWVTEDASR